MRFTLGQETRPIAALAEKLYSYTVECKVYRLYSNGVKLSDQARQTQPKIGRLLFAARIRHQQIRLTVFTAQLLELKREARTVLFTSHALADVAELCDRVAVIHAGTLRYLGTPAALCAQYSCSDLEQAFLRCIDGAAQPA